MSYGVIIRPTLILRISLLVVKANFDVGREVFLFEILDDGALLPIHPSPHGAEQDAPSVLLYGGD